MSGGSSDTIALFFNMRFNFPTSGSKHFVSIYILLLPDVSKDKNYHGSIIQLFVMVMIYSSSYSNQNVALFFG